MSELKKLPDLKERYEKVVDPLVDSAIEELWQFYPTELPFTYRLMYLLVVIDRLVDGMRFFSDKLGDLSREDM